jgi:CBS domain-containing protein
MLSIEELVRDYFYKFHFKTFPVTEGARLVGYVTTREVKAVPHERWPFVRVADVMQRCSPDNTIGPDAPAMDALRTMNSTGNSRLLVAEGERLAGIVSLKDMMNYLFLKAELEGGKEGLTRLFGPS